MQGEVLEHALTAGLREGFERGEIGEFDQCGCRRGPLGGCLRAAYAGWAGFLCHAYTVVCAQVSVHCGNPASSAGG